MEDYKVINEYETSDMEGHKKFYIRKTDKTRERSFFTYKPLWIRNKFRWFRQVTVLESMFLVKEEKEFTLNDKWGGEYVEWRIQEILT